MTKLKIKMKNVNTLSIAHSHRNNEPKTKKDWKPNCFEAKVAAIFFFPKQKKKLNPKRIEKYDRQYCLLEAPTIKLQKMKTTYNNLL